MSVRARGIQFERASQVLFRFRERIRMIAEHAEMQMRLRKIGLQAESFGKFGGGHVKIGFLHQHSA